MDQAALRPLQHTPIRPVREDVVGEVVFVRRWQELMMRWSEPFSEYDAKLHEILRKDVVTQRHASVAALFIRKKNLSAQLDVAIQPGVTVGIPLGVALSGEQA